MDFFPIHRRAEPKHRANYIVDAYCWPVDVWNFIEGERRPRHATPPWKSPR